MFREGEGGSRAFQRISGAFHGFLRRFKSLYVVSAGSRSFRDVPEGFRGFQVFHGVPGTFQSVLVGFMGFQWRVGGFRGIPGSFRGVSGV